MSQKKKTKLHVNLLKHNVDVFAIIEANLTAEKLIYYRLSGYRLTRHIKKTYFVKRILSPIPVTLFFYIFNPHMLYSIFLSIILTFFLIFLPYSFRFSPQYLK